MDKGEPICWLHEAANFFKTQEEIVVNFDYFAESHRPY